MKHLILPLLCVSLLSGCAVTTAGLSKNDERSFAGSLNDLNAGRAIRARMKRAYDYDLGGVDVEVAQGVVLLSGNAADKEDRIEAARIAWSAPNITQVGNEIVLADKQGFVRNAKDGILEKAVRTRLLADGSVKASNFNIETNDGVVYLLGVARTPDELQRAAQIAAQTRGTAEVISYARIADYIPQNEEAAPLGYPSAAAPAQRQLPDFLTTKPQDAEQNSATIQNAPYDEPIRLHRNQALGSTPDAEPYYIDPNTGQKIPVSHIISQHK